MKKSVRSVKLIRICLIIALASVAYSSSLMAQSTDSEKGHKMDMQHKGASMNEHMKMGSGKDVKAESKNGKDESIVRKGVIDLRVIDKNKDGKVFQDQMDWNVISDKPGTCPLCKMTLEEVTLKQAKENLKKNGFKVKE